MLPAKHTDLRPYQDDWHPPFVHVLSVGWLSASEPYRRGPTPPEFHQALKMLYLSELSGSKVLRRGADYDCPFGCAPERVVGDNGRWAGPCGIAEVWIPSESYQIYCSPGLLIHYIQTHEYRPPDCFVNAVLAMNQRTRFDADVARLQSLAIIKRGRPLTMDELLEMHMIQPGDPMPWNNLPPEFEN